MTQPLIKEGPIKSSSQTRFELEQSIAEWDKQNLEMGAILSKVNINEEKRSKHSVRTKKFKQDDEAGKFNASPESIQHFHLLTPTILKENMKFSKKDTLESIDPKQQEKCEQIFNKNLSDSLKAYHEKLANQPKNSNIDNSDELSGISSSINSEIAIVNEDEKELLVSKIIELENQILDLQNTNQQISSAIDLLEKAKLNFQLEYETQILNPKPV